MRPFFVATAIAAACLLAAPLAAMAQATAQATTQATEVAGVKFPANLQVAGSTLLLNGAGVRYKLVFKVYAAGLYLTQKAATPEAVLAAPGPRVMQITMLRDIDANELGKLFARGMEENAPREEFSKSINGVMRMSDIFSTRKKLVAGDSFAVEWLPGTGTVITVNGKPEGAPIKEPEFYTAMIRIWLGNSPADAQLKQALLGKPAAAGGS